MPHPVPPVQPDTVETVDTVEIEDGPSQAIKKSSKRIKKDKQRHLARLGYDPLLCGGGVFFPELEALQRRVRRRVRTTMRRLGRRTCV